MEATTEGIIRRLRGLAEDPSHPRASEFLDIAADRLERLEAEVARLKAQQRWIPVAERLPEDEKSVLVCTEHELRGKRYRLVAKAFYESGKLSTEESQYCWQEAAFGEYDEESDSYKLLNGWWEDVDYTEEFGPIDRPVTHWMPLPETPME